MPYQVLSPSQVEQFIECGYVHLPGTFAPQDALKVQNAIWERLAERGIHKNDTATWTEPIVHLKENYSGPIFEACMTPRFASAIEDLVGPGRWRYRDEPYGWGWWPVNFSRGAEQPWTVPTKGWHWDGGHFRHCLNSPEQGVLALCIFSEIGPRGGATLLAEGSHHIVTRFLSQQTEGLELTEAVRMCSQSHPWLAELTLEQSGFGLSDAGQTGPTATEATEARIAHFINHSFQVGCDSERL